MRMITAQQRRRIYGDVDDEKAAAGEKSGVDDIDKEAVAVGEGKVASMV